MVIGTSTAAFNASFDTMWQNVVTAVPTFLVALVVFSLGLLVASALGTVARKVIRMTKLDMVIEKAASIIRLQTLGYKLDIAKMVGMLVEWFFAIVTLLTVADILHLTQVTTFLRSVALYIPNVLVAVLVLGLGLVLARFVGQLVERGVKSSRMPASAGTLAMIAEWSVVVFAFMVSLTQLGIASRLVEIMFTGLVFGLSVAFGLAFGLGGKEKAREWLEKVSSGMMK